MKARSTIAYPALLARAGAFDREMARIEAKAREPGLFDLCTPTAPCAGAGLWGHTADELQALRAFQMLGDAFGLNAAAQAEWHRLLAYGELPQLDGALLQDHGAMLPDLLLRARTMAQHHDRHGGGRPMFDIWQRTRPLQALWSQWQALGPATREALLAAGRGAAPADPRQHPPAAHEHPQSNHALILQCRAQLLQALIDPVQISQVDGVTRICGLGVATLWVQPQRREIGWGLGNAGTAAMQQGTRVPLDDLTRPGAWIGYFVDRVMGQPAPRPGHEASTDRRHLVSTAIVLLRRDRLVVAGVARAIERFLGHAAVPAAPLALARRAYVDGLRYPFVVPVMVAWVWRHDNLYREALDFMPTLLPVLPQLHRQGLLGGNGTPWLNGLGHLKQRLMAQGLCAQGWRWLRRQPPQMTRYPGSVRYDPGPDTKWIAEANLLGHGGDGFTPSLAFLRTVVGNPHLQALPMRCRAWLASAAWQQCLQGCMTEGEVGHFCRYELAPLLAWAAHTGWQPDAHQRRAGWDAAWRAFVRGSDSALPGDQSWTCDIGALRHEDLTALPLLNTGAMRQEGLVMSHCLVDFAGRAAAGRLLAFSVRAESGQRVATFTFECQGREAPWVEHQCQGRFNRPPEHPLVKLLMAKTGIALNRHRPPQPIQPQALPRPPEPLVGDDDDLPF